MPFVWIRFKVEIIRTLLIFLNFSEEIGEWKSGGEVGQFMREGLDRASLNANGRLCAGAGCRSVNMPRERIGL